MNEAFLFTIEFVGQVGENLLIFPALSANKYSFRDVDKVKIVKPDGQVVQMSAEFSIPLTRPPSFEWWLLIPNTKSDDVPIGSQVWVYKSLEEITRKKELNGLFDE